ncbi:MAG: glycosyltransferase [Solirubrobacteraceae bacterium]
MYAGGERLLLRGVTYGTFDASREGAVPPPHQVQADFAQMALAGVNCVRTYSVPPAWLLDLALTAGLRVMVGLAWEQHVAFLDEPGRPAAIEARLRADVRACARHEAVLCYAVGNEIPTSIVRWHGAPATERFLERLCVAVREEDPGALVTYVNYPSTEYLDLPFLDFVCFNVFLEEQEPFEGYIARLQNLAGERPLVLTEIGLDSARHGEERQARVLRRQLQAAYELGAAGAFVFAWTDEWERGDHEVLDWDFGLVDRDRRPKPSLGAVSEVFAEPVPSPITGWPRASVVVCSLNGARWIGECLEALGALEYPSYEVIVVDDGSSDETAAIAAAYAHVRVISTANGGLSRARNVGLEAADGEIVAYLDDDARPEPSWLTHLARPLISGAHSAVGGPNLAPAGDGVVADCVANAPGGPTHVLLSDREAEHVPGCNMAFLAEALRAAGGFDETFRIAGDDVDVCWRLQEAGDVIGFAAAAVVWHHCRSSVRRYLLQQFQYGRAEGLLERKWPERYNRRGHATWEGRVYGNSLAAGMNRRRSQIQYGTWGQALFQSRHAVAPGLMASLTRMAEWYLALGGLAAVAVLGALWPPLLLALVPLAVASLLTAYEAWRTAGLATFTREPRSRRLHTGMRALAAALHVLQPVVRYAGRRQTAPALEHDALAAPWPRTDQVWSERWSSPAQWLGDLERALAPAHPRRGGAYDRWDLEVRAGLLGVARLRAALEEHGAGRQLARLRTWPVPSRAAIGSTLALALLAVLSAGDGALAAAAVLGGGALAIAACCLHTCAAASGALRAAIDGLSERRAQEQGHVVPPPARALATQTAEKVSP